MEINILQIIPFSSKCDLYIIYVVNVIIDSHLIKNNHQYKPQTFYFHNNYNISQ